MIKDLDGWIFPESAKKGFAEREVREGKRIMERQREREELGPESPLKPTDEY